MVRLRRLGDYVVSALTCLRQGLPGSIPSSAPPWEVDLDVGEGVHVGHLCWLRGDIDLRDAVTVENRVQLSGDITLHEDVRVGDRCRLHGEIDVGRGTNLVEANTVTDDVSIGRHCAIAAATSFQGSNHYMHKPGAQNKLYNTVLDSSLGSPDDGPIEVGNDVWLGRDALVLPDVTIGDGAIVGAKSVVTDDVPPYAIVTGAPASQSGWRFEKPIRDQLLDIEWWNWDEDRIRENKEFFTTDLRTVDDVYDLLQ